MQRDMELIRTILLKIESDVTLNGILQPISANSLGILDCPQEKFAYHCTLLHEAGFIEGNMKLANVGSVVVSRLTFSGHDFLDSVRDPKIWEKTKKGAEGAGGFTVDLLKDLAKGFIKKQIEELTGVKL